MLVFVMWKYFFSFLFLSSCRKLYSNMCGSGTTIMQKKVLDSLSFALTMLQFFLFFFLFYDNNDERETSENFELARNWMIFMCFSSPRQQFLSGFSHYAAYSRENRVRFSDFFFFLFCDSLGERKASDFSHNRGTCVFNTTDFLLCITGIKMNIKGIFFKTEFIAFFSVLNSYKLFCFFH